MKKLLLIIIVSMACSVYSQTDEKESLEQINRQVISLYQNGKFDDALKLAQQVTAGSLKVYGDASRETANAYQNLGLIYREKNKLQESIENFQKAVEIFRKASGLEGREMISAYERLSQALFMNGRKAEAETTQLNAFEFIENKFGKESKESYLAALSTANFHARTRNFEKADEFYLKSYALAAQNFGKTSEEVERINESKFCSGLNTLNEQSKEKFEKFAQARKAILGYDPPFLVINGKTAFLAPPHYPAEAKSRRIGGSVAVKVKVDEQGNVTETRTICGHPILAQATEDAAKKAKFRPAVSDGTATGISGILVYNFVPAPL